MKLYGSANIPLRAEKEGHWNVIIETPKNSRNKYKYDEELCLYKLNGVLPAGHSFPFDFGFFPDTKAEDGDPLDVLLLMDEPVFPGCLVESRIIGVLEAEQTEKDGETVRNDRLIAVAINSPTHSDIEEIDDLNEHLINEIEHFFASYNEIKGKSFKVIARRGPKAAKELLLKAINQKTAKEE